MANWKWWLMLLALAIGCGRGYSEGERTGVVVKFSNKGVFCKTWEGTMNLGGMATNSDGAVVPNVWNFTVTDESLVSAVQAAQRSGGRVTIKYSQWLVAPLCAMDSDYEAVGVARGDR